MANTIQGNQTPGALKPLLTVVEVANQLGTGRDFVYARINEGSLPAVYIGSVKRPKTRIHPDDLEAYVNERRVAR